MTTGSDQIPERMLLGPGPSDCPSRALRAMGAPILGYLDPAYLAIMDETRVLLRGCWTRVTRTSRHTGPCSVVYALRGMRCPPGAGVAAQTSG